jgi:DNA-binding HxlR family transcriptional regulator
MTMHTAELTILRLVGEHEGEWGWYQFERAFPPGWFTDLAPTTSALEVLNRLELDGLVTTVPGEPQRKYHLTDQGRTIVQTVAVGSISA